MAYRFLIFALLLLCFALPQANAETVTGKIHRLQGHVWVNGIEADRQTPIHFGDRILTGVNSRVILSLDQNVYSIHSRSALKLPEQSKNFTLKVLYGAFLAAFRHDTHKTIETQTAVLGVRGTGLYIDTEQPQPYLCLCYGDVDHQGTHIHADYHKAVTINRQSGALTGSSMLGHTDDELRELEALVGRTPPASFLKENGANNSVNSM